MKNLSLMIVLSLALGCAKEMHSTTPTQRSMIATESNAMAFDSMSKSEGFSSGAGEQTPTDPISTAAPSKPQDRLVIHNASITVAVKDVQATIQKTEEIAQSNGGFVVSSAKVGEATYFNPDNGNLTIRVPDAKLNNTLKEIGALGKVTYRSITGQDVTAQYTDLQLRLDNKEKMLTRLRELLAQAENTTVTLEVEKEMNRVSLEIEQIRGNLIFLKDQFTYSTVTVSINKQHRKGPLGFIFYGIAWGVGKLFVLN